MFPPGPRDHDGVIGQSDNHPGLQGADGRILDERASVLIDDLEDVGQEAPERMCLRPVGQGFGGRIHEGDVTLGVRGNHRFADAGQRRAQPFRLLSQFLFGASARGEDALLIPLRPGAKPIPLVVVWRHYRP